MSDWIEIGRIVAAQGLKGEVRVYPSSDFPERFTRTGQRWLRRPGQAQPEAVDLLGGREIAGKNLYVVRLAGVGDRNAAEALRDAVLLVPADDIPELDEGEFHVSDLVGLSVVDQTSGEELGTVVDLISSGPQDLLEVKLTAGRTVLIPFVEELVPVVDLDEEVCEVTLPPGLLEL